ALGVSSPGNDPLALPSVTDTTAASLEAQWQATRQISASARFGYQFVDYEMQDREDDVWRAGLGLTYMVTARLGLVADYEYRKVASSDPSNDYTRNRVTLGARARF